MADLSITAANVVKGSGATVEQGTAGATITAGQVVYKASATGKYGLADCDSATAEVKVPRGIALNGASDGQPLAIVRAGDVTIGATLTPGTAYYLSPVAGGICPLADVASGDNVVLLGLAKSASVLALDIQVSGVTL
jgi:hypothetical protein